MNVVELGARVIDREYPNGYVPEHHLVMAVLDTPADRVTYPRESFGTIADANEQFGYPRDADVAWLADPRVLAHCRDGLDDDWTLLSEDERREYILGYLNEGTHIEPLIGDFVIPTPRCRVLSPGEQTPLEDWDDAGEWWR
jgi:hypothetical protein